MNSFLSKVGIVRLKQPENLGPGHEETRYIIMVLCPSKEKVYLGCLKVEECNEVMSRRQSQRLRQVEHLQLCSQTLTLGQFEIRLKWFSFLFSWLAAHPDKMIYSVWLVGLTQCPPFIYLALQVPLIPRLRKLRDKKEVILKRKLSKKKIRRLTLL